MFITYVTRDRVKLRGGGSVAVFVSPKKGGSCNFFSTGSREATLFSPEKEGGSSPVSR